MRVERHERHHSAFVVARADVSWPDGRFTLTMPERALPTASGRRCALHYLVRAEQPCATLPAELEVAARSGMHLDPVSPAINRLLSSWDARHFHIELVAAELTGGGTLHGRLHRHGQWPPGTIVIRARCLELWRPSALTDPWRPHWRHDLLWEAQQPVRADPDRCWVPFWFRLPEGLPPAVEAVMVAWRYELFAERSVRHWFNETAALTPLAHEHLAS